MKKIFSQIILATLLILIGSCKKDKPDIAPPSNPKTYSEFIVENKVLDQANPYYQYIMLTNQKGEILYENIKPEKTNQITSQVADGDIVDLTVINLESRIFTFRNIKSGFVLQPFTASWFKSCFGNYQHLKLDIKITGISDYDALYFSSVDTIIRQNNSITVNSNYIYLNDKTLTIRPKGSTEYLSYLVKYDDLNFLSYQKATKEISIEDFQPSKIYEVAVSEKGKYTGSLVIWQEDKFSFTNRDFGYKELEKGERLKFYVSSELTNDLKELNIVKKNDNNISSKKIFSEQFPEKVNIRTSNIDIDANGTSYNYSSSTNFDLGMVQYFFINPNTWQSMRWNVFQSENDKKPYKLPNIKNSVLSESIKDILKYPNEVYFETIKFETGMENLEDVFDMCRDYESVSVSRKL